MSQPARHSVSVAGVIVDNQGRILVIQRQDNGAWQIPGGVLEADEAIHDGLRREVKEETGVDVQPVRLTGVYKNIKLGVVALVFLAEHVAGTPHPTEESSQVAWWTPGQVATGMSEAFAIRVQDALADGTSPAIRIHDGVRLLDTAA